MTTLRTELLATAGPPVGHAQLANMVLAYQTLIDCMEAGESSPRLGLFFGWSGYGKSVGAAFASARTGAAYIVALSIWSQRSFLSALARELGIVKPARTAPAMLEQIIDELNRFPRPLIIDEMDHLVKKHMVDIIRDIHDATSIAIMMIGEESLPAKLKEWERFDNRILVATAAQPCSEDDALKLRDHYCRKVAVADDLALLFQQRCNGVTRRVVVNLQHAERQAAIDDVTVADRAWWGNRSIRTGEITTRRSMGGQ